MTNEKRLIDAIELANFFGFMRKMWSGSEIMNVIHEAETVDAVEVKHGEWVVCGDGEYVPFMCSACGKTTSWYHAQTANYCPNCGADMRGDGNA